jgi:hypothetical protein
MALLSIAKANNMKDDSYADSTNPMVPTASAIPMKIMC